MNRSMRVTLVSHHVNFELTVCSGIVVTEFAFVWSNIYKQENHIKNQSQV